jgi:hypothetical protein
MKPILLLAFLAVGPALADQFPLTAPASDPLVDAVAPAASDAPAAAAAVRTGEHVWLCGR